jgi:hypothetical protein
MRATVRIAISVEAFEAIARTLPLGSVGYEAEANERGERLIWLDAAMAGRLGAMRGPSDAYSEFVGSTQFVASISGAFEVNYTTGTITNCALTGFGHRVSYDQLYYCHPSLAER